MDIGIKVDFLISWIHSSGIYVRLAFFINQLNRRAMWIENGGSSCFHISSQADRQTVIFEKEILHSSSEIWQADPSCRSFQCVMFSLHQSVPIITEAEKAASEHECCDYLDHSLGAVRSSWTWLYWHEGLKLKRKLWESCGSQGGWLLLSSHLLDIRWTFCLVTLVSVWVR